VSESVVDVITRIEYVFIDKTFETLDSVPDLGRSRLCRPGDLRLFRDLAATPGVDVRALDGAA